MTNAEIPEDLLDLYFRDIGAVPLLTAEDEQRLAQRIEAGVASNERTIRILTGVHQNVFKICAAQVRLDELGGGDGTQRRRGPPSPRRRLRGRVVGQADFRRA